MAANKKAKRGQPTSERWLQKIEGKRVKKRRKKRARKSEKQEWQGVKTKIKVKRDNKKQEEEG